MPILENRVVMPSTVAALDLVVSVQGLALTVAAGTFKHDGVEHTLVQDETVTISSHDHTFNLFVWLVLHEGAVSLLVDEIGPNDRMFSWLDHPEITLLHRLVRVSQAPASCTDLAPLDIYVTRIKEEFVDASPPS
jgi:hypothetical protein